MAAKIPFPYHPANKFHAGVKARFEVEAQTPQSIDLLTKQVDTGSQGTQKAIGDVAKAIRRYPDGDQSKTFERLTAAMETIATALQNQPKGSEIDKKLGNIGKAIDRFDETVRSFGLRDRDNVTALYAAAVDTTGDIVGRTNAGQWLIRAEFPSLQAIVKFQKTKPQDERRSEFVKRVRAVEPVPPGLPATITDSELARFFDLVPAVISAINASQDTGSSEPPKA
ncbi:MULTISPECIES: hypothetical protein [unclassified Mesorhizobium]|uniref:hypothetical protein n=1 Tax=unclassified Mesorhizobium TaxID=325217 RepID=UPI0010933999|nr:MULTISPECIES: hypothetical protein [unclassified Mesorhizobium]TGT87503.1 hypothetical protein EN804_17300 [Mesorhizobium sp. M8A.F.Ca.ET.161.01.1.1]TGV41378.1 hypothetical protein EN785_17285 [Mesorhizobium sp. M8A.F.Ca.ET.142.01.1.1]